MICETAVWLGYEGSLGPPAGGTAGGGCWDLQEVTPQEAAVGGSL